MNVPETPPNPLRADESNLNSLATGHYAAAGLIAFFACFPLFHVFIGLSMVFGDGFFDKPEQAPPAAFGWLFFSMGLVFFLMGQALAVCVFLSGRYIKKRKNYVFTFVVGCVACAFVPLGTILGVFTIILLSKDSVKTLYGRT